MKEQWNMERAWPSPQKRLMNNETADCKLKTEHWNYLALYSTSKTLTFVDVLFENAEDDVSSFQTSGPNFKRGDISLLG